MVTSTLALEQNIQIIGSTDTTISLTRNAHSLILLWAFISSNPYNKQVADIPQCQKLVQYAVGKLQELQKRIGLDLMIMNFPPSLSILFRKPNPSLVLKHTLSLTTLFIESKKEECAQIYIMRHITAEKTDSFIAELEQPDAFVEL